MVFNSVVFLFCFLPLSLLLYYLVPGRAKMQCCWQKASSSTAGPVLRSCR
ncbi:hypothetical protein NIA69_15300 [Gemmiger formicilis]|nr:hypothetical protein [Gemmiger formicilis]